MRVGVDAMGGDLAPAEPVKGALAARDLLAEGDQIVLIGDEKVIRRNLDGQEGWEEYIRIAHASQAVGMDETPVEAIRQKPDSSIAKMAAMAAAGEVDAVVSAGNTGACVVACQMRLRRLRGAHRPGIAIVIPAYSGPVTMCDVGANVSCRPQHLYQYGVMASEYARCICGVTDPRVGLLNIGQEDAKGTDLVKKTRDLLRRDPSLRFIGFVEGRDIFHGVCDVVVSDGFVGNVALKLMEGLAEGLFKSMCMELMATQPELYGGFEAAISGLRDRYDFNEYGGAPLLGVDGICIICHGASRGRGITNAIRVARDYASRQVNERIMERLARSPRNGS